MRARSKPEVIIEKVARAYVEEITAKFPGVRPEVIVPGLEGHDIWIRVEFPESLTDEEEAILDETVELNLRFYDEAGVSTVATVVPMMSETTATVD